MSILNVTPDSFSDGGSYSDTSSAVSAALSHIVDGADIIDIGGVSTRPGSTHVSEAEELSRIIPVIEQLRKEEGGVNKPITISVDTYRASVAERAVRAGANIINDISGGMYDPDMLSTIAKLDVPFVLMHMRGPPTEVNLAKHQHYEGGDVVSGVRKELAASVRKALDAGINRWNIILDPGIGFSKNQEGNLALLRHLPQVTGRQLPFEQEQEDEDARLLRDFPVLVGVSRKGFLGKITGKDDSKQREYANAAVHALAIASGANIIRVHDVQAARDAARIADAIYQRS